MELTVAAAVAREQIVALPQVAIDPAIAVSVGAIRLAAERHELEALYAPRYVPVWVDRSGQPTPAAREVLRRLATAGEDGLDPADYDHPAQERAAGVLNETTAAPEAIAGFDVGLSLGLLRYLRHLHSGRVDPRAIGFRLRAPTDEHDYGPIVSQALATGRLPETIDGLRPQLAAYDALRAFLPRYRALAADPTLTDAPRPARALHPGDQYDGAAALTRRLLAFADLSPEEAPASDAGVYDGAVVTGVKRFQARHGLEPDGIVGAATLSALQMPVAWRVRQIELGLERLRWLPHTGNTRLVVVNIPMFRLWAWDSVPSGGAPVAATDVIVGKALNTRTPVFVEELREVIFRPYWNVPSSILRNEILPQLRRDPGYLQKHDMEIVTPDGRVVDAADNLSRIGRGLGLRQRPGYRNSLGLVKFAFPNEENVYMHDTPAQELFSRSRRDFSHGCVRVRDPVGLAEWALAGADGWNRDRILAAMTGAHTLHVKVPRRTQVVLFSTTALPSPEDGTLRFAADIYGHDQRLDRALAARHRRE